MARPVMWGGNKMLSAAAMIDGRGPKTARMKKGRKTIE